MLHCSCSIHLYQRICTAKFMQLMPSNSHRHIHAPHIHAWLMQLHSRSTCAAALRPQHLYRRAHAATLFRMSHAAAFMQHLARGGIFRSQHSRCSSHAANSLSHLRCRSHATAFTLLRRCSSRALAQALCSGGGGVVRVMMHAAGLVAPRERRRGPGTKGARGGLRLPRLTSPLALPRSPEPSSLLTAGCEKA